MISKLDNSQGYISSYIEWYVLNEHGQFEEDGEYIYIHDLWIHPDKRRGKALKHLILKIDKHPTAWKTKWVYWKNYKHNERLTKPFPRERLAKLGVKNGI